jgi:hypothetical protein
MGGMAVACKNGISTSILSYGWHGGSDFPIALSLWRMGCIVVAFMNVINPSILLWVGWK